MRIVTWNCNSSAGIKSAATALCRFDTCLAAVKPFLADVTVLQEVPDPGSQVREGCWTFWRGQMLGRGIAVVLERSRYPQARVVDHSRSSLLVCLGPPHGLQVLALWSCPEVSGFQAYLNETREVVRHHESQLQAVPTVVVGDFNSSSTWDVKARAFSHSDLVRWLESEFGLRSAYHAHHGVSHGAELHPTFYQYRHEDKPHHLDYCFLPADWPVLSVSVGGHSDWSRLSDHTPLVVEVEVPTSRQPVAYVQANEAGSPYSQHGEAAARGFENLGYVVRLFRRAELEELPLDDGHVLVGGAGTTRAALLRLGIPDPGPLNLPRELEPYWGRKVWHTMLGDLEDGDFPVFIKPADFAKAFDGQVVRSRAEIRKLYLPRVGFPQLTPETRVQAQDVLELASEWRVFVTHSTVQGIWNYAGSPLTFPKPQVIKMAIGAYTGGPVGYAADFAVTTAGRTLLLEVNDGYSLGQGGISVVKYARLLEARWHELTARALREKF